MLNRRPIVSILLFTGSALSFFLPFATVSCGGVKLVTLSGQQLATGSSFNVPQPFGPPKVQRTAPDPFATVAGLCALAGLALSFAGKRFAAAGASSGAAGAVSLGLMASRMENRTHQLTQGLAQANLETGFMLSVSLMVAATVWNIYLLYHAKSSASSGDEYLVRSKTHSPSASGPSSEP
jgi:hypothetical protein